MFILFSSMLSQEWNGIQQKKKGVGMTPDTLTSWDRSGSLNGELEEVSL